MVALCKPPSLVAADWAAYLESSPSAGDVRLACSDGVVRWSSLSLLQWSGVFAEHAAAAASVSCPDCDGPAADILLPDFDAATARRAAEWAARGEVTVTGDAASRVMELLMALGVQVCLVRSVVKRATSTPAAKEKPPRVPEKGPDAPRAVADANQLRIKERPSRVLKKRSVNGVAQKCEAENRVKKCRVEITKLPSKIGKRKSLPDVDAAPEAPGEAENRSPKGEFERTFWKCPECPASGPSGMYGLKGHLSAQHYADRLAADWAEAVDGGMVRCRECGFQARAAQRSDIARHLGVTHGRILRYAPEEELRGRLERVPAARRAGEGWGCPICPSAGHGGTYGLWQHLSCSHYRGALLRRWTRPSKGGGGRRCDVCGEVANGGKSAYRMARHVGARHKKVLELIAGDETPEGPTNKK